ncbi:MAG: hypothetical protein QG599_709 [Pseudomonadota bacterium]|nr:hypothetical protein [Pseudomonadota bacterium]
MNTAIGIDLNGVLDTVAYPDEKLHHAPVPPIVITDLPQGILTGEEAILSPFGRPRLAETVGCRTSILELLRALELDSADPEAPRQMGQHLHSLLPKGNRSCVIAVPDIPTFNERARDRLLSGASQCGVNARLLWRPVAALLGWGEDLNPKQLLDLQGKRACILQLLPEGIAVSELDLECVEQDAQLTLVPVRRREGLRKLYPYSNRELPILLAAEMGITDQRLLWASAWAWNALLGHPAECDLLPDTQSPSGWRLVGGVSNLQGELAKALSATVQKLLKEDQSALRQASVILIEGPLAHASIKPQLREATRLLDFIKVLIAPLSAAHVIAVPTTAGLVARGGAICAERQQKGQITYYDFLPMLEINVLRSGEHVFAALIDKNDRVEGGKTYSNTLADRYQIDKEAKNLIFYLLKEDEQTARCSEITLSPEGEVKISLHVTQMPAQGYARVEICPEVRGALGNVPILLDWAAMAVDYRTREQILAGLNFGGYPDTLPQYAHRLIWEKTDILATMRNINTIPIRDRYYDSAIEKKHLSTRGYVGTRISPFVLTGGIDPDKYIYTAVDSEGHLPTGINLDVVEEFNIFLEKIKQDFITANTARNRNINHIEQLARLGATLYTGCPEAIIGYYRRVVSSPDISSRLFMSRLVMYAGKVFSSEQDLIDLFKYCERRYRKAHRDGNNLSWYVVKAAGDALAYRENAGKILDPRLADSLADAMIYALKWQVNNGKYRNPFKLAIRLSAFILRHRMHDQYRDFLHIKSPKIINSQRAKELLKLLEISLISGALNEDLENNIIKLKKHITEFDGRTTIIDIPPAGEDDE